VRTPGNTRLFCMRPRWTPTGGLGNCTPCALVRAAARYGATAGVPMLWIMRQTTSTPPSLAAWSTPATEPAAGRPCKPFGPNGEDGHNLATSADGPAVWTPLVENFLRTLR
jgi:hypothetical protein